MIKLRELDNAQKRRETLEKELNISLENIGEFSFTEEQIKNKNIENLVGAVQMPLGVAGPIKIRTKNSGHRTCYVPLVTTEGALVASINRGCKAVNESGGTNVYLEKVGITRGPVFKTKSLGESFELKEWLDKHFNDINHRSQETSSHIELKKIESQVVGLNVFVKFYFDTQEAMGMNMVTIATNSIVKLIEKRTGVKCLSLSGNCCVDKKPAWANFIGGRGRKIWAQSLIPEKVIKEILKTNTKKIYDVWLSKCMIGSAISGALGFNSHFANIVAAIFAATGQDLAHITEGSLGITTGEVQGNDLSISVYLPDLVLGTVGGGTCLPTQKEAIGIIFGQEKPQVDVLAQVIAGAVLAGELSLLASLAEGSLACSHERLGRGRCSIK